MMKLVMALFLIALALSILFVSLRVSGEIDVTSDPNNCGMVDNRCEQGDNCINAVCIKPSAL